MKIRAQFNCTFSVLTIDLREGYRENNCKENCAKDAWIFFNPVGYLSQAAFRLIVRWYNFLSHLLFWNFHIKIELIFVYLITWFAFISRIFICSNLICFQSNEFIHCIQYKFIVSNKYFFRFKGSLTDKRHKRFDSRVSQCDTQHIISKMFLAGGFLSCSPPTWW